MKAAFPTEKDVARIMAFKPFKPITGETAAERATRESDCRAAVADTLCQVRGHNTKPIGEVRRQAEKYARKLSNARAALDELGRLYSADLARIFDAFEIQTQTEMLDRLLRQTDDGLANNSGYQELDSALRPKSPTKPAVSRTRLAALRAFYLLRDFWNITPAAWQGGAWHKLTKLLCEISIGPKGHDALRACQWLLAHGRLVMKNADRNCTRCKLMRNATHSERLSTALGKRVHHGFLLFGRCPFF